MVNKRIIGKIRTQINQNDVVQKIVTIPKQEETIDWNKGDLVEIKKIVIPDSTNNKKEATNENGTGQSIRHTSDGHTRDEFPINGIQHNGN